MSENPVLFESANGLAHFVLNRPAALNALNARMISDIARNLSNAMADASVRAVVLRSSSPRAFCAGGDVRALVLDWREGVEDCVDYFGQEYTLDHEFYSTPKPVVSLLDSITMGGGLGLARGTTFRVVTERTRMAMPETRIGFFPDVGATHFLSRLPGHTGLYLGLTGTEVGPRDALYCGFANYQVASDDLPALLEALDTLEWTGNARADLVRLLEGFRVPESSEPAPLEQLSPAIEAHFSKGSVLAIRDSLRDVTSGPLADWAGECLERLEACSPLALVVTHELWTRGREMPLADCFALEEYLARQWLEGGEMVEGVRALLIDKDRTPRWSPPTLEALDPARVAAFFEGFSAG
ncbi:enoyl-CoA hydratase/isomerase family protein [Phaeovibrio sulfidiphilus]|uniref:3-hydroxyisobutyryl-CoA hydrolase n=1 Tax=Phaeovibrio sulfidiphilus TaxID=1220600 RepID=A0A8J6YLT5_9PROT|nr:enoyl-CoA hydratase/isomerase family protein [Phaeovibrio sulfidiphilus]MBE1236144.1 enoyl-CoA hydratase/isomerase family protein [Phaeovibrio sulfidiphilus]